MVSQILLRGCVLVRPIDPNLCVKDLATIQGIDSGLCCPHLVEFDKAIVETVMLEIAIRDDLDT